MSWALQASLGENGLSWRAESNQTDGECENPDSAAQREGKEGCQLWH